MNKEQWKAMRVRSFSELTNKQLVDYFAMAVIICRCMGIDTHPTIRFMYIDRRDRAEKEMRVRSL